MADDEHQQVSDTDLPDTQEGEGIYEGSEAFRDTVLSLEADPNIHKIYANQISSAYSPRDFVIVLSRSDSPQALLYLPQQTIKDFVEAMKDTLAILEETATGGSHDNSSE